MNIICKAFGHRWRVNEAQDTNATRFFELTPKWKKTCKRCGHTLRVYDYPKDRVEAEQ